MSISTRSGIFWNTIGSLMLAANSAILVMFVSRSVNLVEVGRFGISLTTAQLMYFIGLFGANNYQMTDYQNNFSFADYRDVKLISLALSAIVCGIVILSISDRTERLYLLLLTFFMAINAYAELFQAFFFQNNRLDISGKSLFFRYLFSTSAFTVTIIITHSVFFALLSLVSVNIVTTWFWTIRPSKNFAISTKRDANSSRVVRLLIECVPLFLNVFLINYALNAPKYAIEGILDNHAQGLFNIIFVPAQVVNLCSLLVFKPMLRGYALLWEDKDTNQLSQSLLKHSFLLLVFTCVCGGLAYILGKPVVELLFHVDIQHLIIELVIIIFGGGAFALSQMLFFILLLMRKQIAILIIYIVTSFFATIVSWLLVQQYAILGASIAFLITFVFLTTTLICCIFYQIRKDESRRM